MTLALWKSAIFLEGSYKRRLAGTTEDPFFDLLKQGVPEVADRAWRIAQGSDVSRDGLLVDFGGVLTTNVFAVVRGVLPRRGPRPRHGARPLLRRPGRARRCSVDLEDGQLDQGGVRAALRRRCSASTSREGLIDRLFGGMRPDERDVRRRAPPRKRRRDPHRAGLELLGRGGLRPLALRRAVRRAGDLRRDRDPQAGAARSTRWPPSGSAARPSAACSSTTCRATSSRRARSGWRPCCTATPRRRSPQLEALLGVSLR